MPCLAKAVDPIPARWARHETSLCAAAYSFLALVVFLPILLHGQFLSDDWVLLHSIKHGEAIWRHAGQPFYRPAVGSLLAVSWRLFGPNPLGYHATNVALLVIASLLVRAIGISVTRSLRAGSVAGGIFLLWITHSETVCWISGVTDGLSVALALAGLHLAIEYRLAPTLSKAVATIAFFWFALVSKESVVTWPLIAWVFTLVCVKWNFQSGRERLQRLAEGVVLCVLTIGYVGLRAHVLGDWVAGYGAGTHFNFNPVDFYAKVYMNLANALFPMNKFVGLWTSLRVVEYLTWLIGVVCLALALRRVPARKRPSTESSSLSRCLVLLAAGELIVHLHDPVLLGKFGSRILIGDLAAASLVIGGLLYVRRRYGAAFLKARTSAFWIGTGFALANFFSESSAPILLALMAGYLLLAFDTRPDRNRSTTSADSVWLRVAIASIIAVILAMTPALTLNININGESSRFSYGPSVFSALLLVSLGRLYVRYLTAQFVLIGTFLSVSLVGLVANNMPWVEASNISEQTAIAIRSALPARRIYILAAPDTISAAYLFRLGLEDVADVRLNDAAVQIRTAAGIRNAIPSDIVVCTDQAGGYRLSMSPNLAMRRFYAPELFELLLGAHSGWFDITDGIVRLVGFDPRRDRVMVIDGQSARVLPPPKPLAHAIRT